MKPKKTVIEELSGLRVGGKAQFPIAKSTSVRSLASLVSKIKGCQLRTMSDKINNVITVIRIS